MLHDQYQYQYQNVKALLAQVLVKLDNSQTHLLNFTLEHLDDYRRTPVPGTSNEIAKTISSSCTGTSTSTSNPPQLAATDTSTFNSSHTNASASASSNPRNNFTSLCITKHNIIQELSKVTSIPQHMLRLYNFSKTLILQNQTNSNSINNNNSINQIPVFFLSAFTYLPIRGGKGGFGTLLKGQSKQAGAKRTIDFGACRDLNGRRLRHVNDEIKLRKWREAMQLKIKAQQSNNGNGGMIDVEQEMEQLRTSSGIRNWHLMIPSWSEADSGGLSGKARRKFENGIRREIENMARQGKLEYEQKMKKKESIEQSIISYAKTGEEYYGKDQDEKMTTSILEGMRKRKKRKVNDQGSHDKATNDCEDITDENIQRQDKGEDAEGLDFFFKSSHICTLSGDLIVEDIEKKQSQQKTKMLMIQSKSEFATSTVLLSHSLLHHKLTSNKQGFYYEITIQTGGVAQIGWAKILSSKDDGVIQPSTGKNGFLPNSDIGDGVGDDVFSYGFDGQRRLLFHNGKEKPYEQKESWKAGDIIGCLYNYRSGIIQYSINGEALGEAFDLNYKSESTDAFQEQLLYPAFSLNENEIIGLNLGPQFEHCPNDYIAVCDLINDENKLVEISSKNDECIKTPTETNVSLLVPSKPDSHKTKDTTSENVEKKQNTKVEDKVQGLNLNEYTSAKELENIEPERLKEELFVRGCKCGGSIEERASRLFSLKGLTRDQYPKKVRGKNFTTSN